MPSALFDTDGARRFLIDGYYVGIDDEDVETAYYLPTARAGEDDYRVCTDFLEIECVAVTQYSTVWQYTGNMYSDRTYFDPDDYIGAVQLTGEEIQFFIGTCDEAYTGQAAVYGDPRWEDRRGDRDGKAAYVALDLSVLKPETAAYYSQTNTDWAGFDCLVIGSNRLPGRRAVDAWQEAEDNFTGMLIHELNHYIVSGCIGHAGGNWSKWVGEAFAQSAIYAVQPESTAYLEYRIEITDQSSRLRLIPGFVWSNDVYYPLHKQMAYTLGPYFLRYVEREVIDIASAEAAQIVMNYDHVCRRPS